MEYNKILTRFARKFVVISLLLICQIYALRCDTVADKRILSTIKIHRNGRTATRFQIELWFLFISVQQLKLISFCWWVFVQRAAIVLLIKIETNYNNREPQMHNYFSSFNAIFIYATTE